MRLSDEALPRLDGRVDVPAYDRSALVPSVVHIGVGGFHRSHLATYIDDLCRAGHRGWGIVGAGVMPQDARMADALQEQDGLYTLLARDGGQVEQRVIGSLLSYIHAYPDASALIEQIADARTAIVSLTVTEGGYPVDDVTGAFDPASPNATGGSAFDVLVRGLARRRDLGTGPVTVLSCDNVSGNGAVARAATLGVAAHDAALATWIDANVSFPNSMVDRITPATTDADLAYVESELGYRDAWPVVAEPFRQWVVEDRFAGVRLPLEEMDVIVADDVEPYELFKLRLLNASHSCLAYLARVAGHERVDQVMGEERFAEYVRRFLDLEAGPVVPDAPGIDLASYKDQLLLRFANPAVGDQVDRLCQDGSSKFPKFLVPTLRLQVDRGGPIGLSILALAGWCRYLQGTHDDGTTIALAADPHLEEAVRYARAAEQDAAAFVAYDRVFGDLSAEARVVDGFRAALQSLQASGVRGALDRALALD